MASAPAHETSLFTIGVFTNHASATAAVGALRKHGIGAGALSVVAAATPEAVALVEQTTGVAPTRLTVKGLGEVLVAGPLLAALDVPAGDLSRSGLASTLRRVGFQPHDGHIYETLTARGGVLIAICSDARASDALETLHNYGGGNAAIGAWRGRV